MVWLECHTKARRSPPNQYALQRVDGPIQPQGGLDCGLFTVLCMEAVNGLNDVEWPEDFAWAEAQRLQRAQTMILRNEENHD